MLSDMTNGPWECFRDASYYDMWCVRQVHDRTFGHGFHLVDSVEAARLRDFLNNASSALPELIEALRAFVDGDASDDIDARYENARSALTKAGGPNAE